MREVAIISTGMTRVNEHWDKSLKLLAGEASLEALQAIGLGSIDGIFIGNMLSGAANLQQQLGAYLADWIGQKQCEALHIESACSSGSAAFRAALIAVASGELETALAVGAEKMTDSPGAEITASLATAADADWEVSQGISFVALNALIMRRYMHEYKWEHKHFAPFSINAHQNGCNNPKARFQKPITEETYLKAPIVADPINIMDASAIGDGAAAVVLTSLDNVKKLGLKNYVKVLASAAATDTLAVHSRKEPLFLTAAYRSSKQAYGQANCSPNDIDIFELHDAFSIMAALSLEASGFAERGQAPQLALDGDITPEGQLPIATMGGLKARGHPVGATGMYQIVETALQLMGTAGAAQISKARIGMTQNIGGSGSNIITHIFQKP
ncbi:MAG: thiolase domain-containing protein [Anaerolineaceae bacterium]|nr:thiolase domain-containing protein [Anaerolineaceae bacterium]